MVRKPGHASKGLNLFLWQSALCLPSLSVLSSLTYVYLFHTIHLYLYIVLKLLGGKELGRMLLHECGLFFGVLVFFFQMKVKWGWSVGNSFPQQSLNKLAIFHLFRVGEKTVKRILKENTAKSY